MASKKHLALLKQGRDHWNAWRLKHPGIQPDLSSADLSYANLSCTDLSYANLSCTDLSSVDLHNADLRNADLSGAVLTGADLSSAVLSAANLSSAVLSAANLSSANLSSANLSGAYLWDTVFARNDLSTVKGLVEIDYRGPSIIQLHTVSLPQDDSAVHFLRGTGIPEIFIEYLPSLLTTPIQYHSIFLSYCYHDEAFTKRLHSDLLNEGVRCWFAPHDLRPGTPILRGLEEAIHLSDKFLLILSEHAVRSRWIEREVDAALHQEIKRGIDVLFPIRLDNAVLQSRAGWATRLQHRHIADFTAWQDGTAYQQAFDALLRHLKANKPTTR